MGSRIQPVALGSSPDVIVNQRLEESRDGWWKDTEMFGVIGRVPDLLKSIVPVFESFFGGGRIDAYLFELMRLKTGQANDCTY
jgi:hypothetical protein|tara:strand:+ start:1374 stop:1622 length:249 start_codon:yes stop_codon:yes gene_type:complete